MNYNDYLDAGMKIIPIYGVDNTGACECGNPECTNQRKHPLQSGWQMGIEYDEEQLDVMEMMGNLVSFGVLCDGYYIVDVDPRNGGWDDLEALNKDLGYDIADKCGFIVTTGGGGRHYYFKNEENKPLVSHDKRYKGIDFKCSGFVCGCGSLHKSGLEYESLKGYPDEITELPCDIAEHFKKVERNYEFDGGSYDCIDVASMLDVLDPNSDYEQWVTIGMAVHDATDGECFDLWDSWSSRGESYPGCGELQFKWASFGKCSSPVTAGTLIHLAREAGWVQSCTFTATPEEIQALEKAQSEMTQEADGCPFDYKNIDIYQPPGFVGQVAQWINGNCLYPRERLSVLAAISTVSAVAGVNNVANVGWGDTQLNLACVGLAGSASGKQAVIDCSLDLIKASGLGDTVSGDIRSSKSIYEGLLRNQCYNLIMDEMGSLLQKAIGKRTSEHNTTTSGVLMAAVTASKTITCDVKLLDDERERLATKFSRLQERIANNEDKTSDPVEAERQFTYAASLLNGGICEPYFGMFGTTTESTFRPFVTMENVTSGLIGRLLIAQEHNDNPRKNKNFNPTPLPPHIKLKLGALMATGNTDTNYTGKILRSEYKRKINADGEAMELIEQLDDWLYDVAQKHEEGGTGMVPVVRRSLEKIIKVAGVCAAVDGQIKAEHIKYATAFVIATTGDLIKRAMAVSGSLSKQKDERAEGLRMLIVEHCTAGKTKTAIVKTVARESGYKRDDVVAMIEHMISENKLSVVKGGTSPNAIRFEVNE